MIKIMIKLISSILDHHWVLIGITHFQWVKNYPYPDVDLGSGSEYPPTVIGGHYLLKKWPKASCPNNSEDMRILDLDMFSRALQLHWL